MNETLINHLASLLDQKSAEPIKIGDADPTKILEAFDTALHSDQSIEKKVRLVKEAIREFKEKDNSGMESMRKAIDRLKARQDIGIPAQTLTFQSTMASVYGTPPETISDRILSVDFSVFGNESINGVIAELIGWRNVGKMSEGVMVGDHPKSHTRWEIPNFMESLDACAQFESSLDASSRRDYAKQLRNVASARGNAMMKAGLIVDPDGLSDFHFYCAIPPWRCEAFLRLMEVLEPAC